MRPPAGLLDFLRLSSFLPAIGNLSDIWRLVQLAIENEIPFVTALYLCVEARSENLLRNRKTQVLGIHGVGTLKLKPPT